MRRLHLFELEDFSWVPRPIRDGGTDLLDSFFARIGFYDGVAPRLVQLLRDTQATRVIDLCSGGGGGTLQLRERVREAGLPVAFALSDLHPNEAGIARTEALGDPSTRYLPDPVDARSAAGEEPGVRTISSALHHFPPETVRALIAELVAKGHPLAFFDVAANAMLRKLPVALVPLAMPLNALPLLLLSLLLTPLIRPFRWSRLALTYVVPAIPLLYAWDGTVSALRAYTPEELLAIARSVPGAERYAWEAGEAGLALYLTGRPS